ncbi:hypothetical protein SVIOM342S_03850 [Streptomyces violaceorubidus]
MPLFFAIAGWVVLSGAPPRDGRQVRRRLTRIVVPLAVWTALYLLWDRVRDANTEPTRQLARDAVFASVRPAFHLWYLYAYVPVILLLSVAVLVKDRSCWAPRCSASRSPRRSSATSGASSTCACPPSPGSSASTMVRRTPARAPGMRCSASRASRAEPLRRRGLVLAHLAEVEGDHGAVGPYGLGKEALGLRVGQQVLQEHVVGRDEVQLPGVLYLGERRWATPRR